MCIHCESNKDDGKDLHVLTGIKSVTQTAEHGTGETRYEKTTTIEGITLYSGHICKSCIQFLAGALRTEFLEGLAIAVILGAVATVYLWYFPEFLYDIAQWIIDVPLILKIITFPIGIVLIFIHVCLLLVGVAALLLTPLIALAFLLVLPFKEAKEASKDDLLKILAQIKTEKEPNPDHAKALLDEEVKRVYREPSAEEIEDISKARYGGMSAWKTYDVRSEAYEIRSKTVSITYFLIGLVCWAVLFGLGLFVGDGGESLIYFLNN